MEHGLSGSPGTVSKILWHFTGGPTWNAKLNKQNKRPKPGKDAYASLTGILREKTLKLGNYREIVSVVLPEMRVLDTKTMQSIVEKGQKVEIQSAPVCCVADIPIMHLAYLAPRYGKFAIGFYRDALIRHGFNPVLYTLHDTDVMRDIYNGLTGLGSITADSVEMSIDMMQDALDKATDKELAGLVGWVVEELDGAARFITKYRDSARKSLHEFLAFIKTFDKDEFGTIYCEREWRSVEAYKFAMDDIAMIMVPRSVGGTNYYKDFVEKNLERLKIPARLPIVPWEDLVEH
jgi:hypothetical protein